MLDHSFYNTAWDTAPLWTVIQTFSVTFRDSLALSHVFLSFTRAMPPALGAHSVVGFGVKTNLSLNASPASYWITLDKLCYPSGPQVFHLVY